MAAPEPNQLQMEAFKSLEKSICAEDANAVENAVTAAYRSGLHSVGPMCCKIILRVDPRLCRSSL